MSIWETILDKITTANYKNTGNRMDKEAQEDIRSNLEKGRSINIKNVQSSRWTSEDGEDGVNYTSDELADMNAEPETETSVNSTAVRSIRYNPKTQDLNIRYVKGDTEYTFPGVPSEEVAEFLESPSKGKFLAYQIKPKYGV